LISVAEIFSIVSAEGFRDNDFDYGVESCC